MIAEDTIFELQHYNIIIIIATREKNLNYITVKNKKEKRREKVKSTKIKISDKIFS